MLLLTEILRLLAKSIRNVLQEIEIDLKRIMITIKGVENEFSVLLSPTDFHWGKYASTITGDEYNRDIAKEKNVQIYFRCFGSCDSSWHT